MGRQSAAIRTEYRALFVVALLLCIGTTFILVFTTRPDDLGPRLLALEDANAQLAIEVTTLMASTLSFSTRYIQNGTCALGFPLQANTAVQSTADFSDYVVIDYSLREISLTPANVPITILTFGVTPRPITFPGYTPSISSPLQNTLLVEIAQCSPPIATLDALAQNVLPVAYSYTVASRIAITPNCVATTLADHDSAHCTEEVATNPRFASSFPTPNGFNVIPNNLGVDGDAVLQMWWGQWNYGSFLNQYDFTGTNISFTAPLDVQLPNV
jgi:hypothetical protein